MVRFAINGFGRIGRLVTRVLLKNPEKGELVAINNPDLSLDYLIYLLKHDSVHGMLKDDKVKFEKAGRDLIINGKKIRVTDSKDPAALKWNDVDCDVLMECSGKFLTQEKSKVFLDTGAKKVLMSAPAKDDTPTFVVGVNCNTYKPEQKIISNASCTTNCLAPVAKVIHKHFGLKEGLMTTVHATTATQLTVDGASVKDWRAGRAAAANIIPSSTGAAKAVTKVIPELKGKLTGMAFRVPTVDVSVVDLTFKTEKETSYEEICKKMKEESEGSLKNILGYTDEEVVSADFIHDPRSSIFDAKAGIGLNSNFFKIVSWYDNEWGYSNRMVDMGNIMTNKK